MAFEHPRGLTTFASRQVRYLFISEHDWLGAAGFSASALRMAPRDTWVAWDDAQAQAHFQRITGLRRYLIRPMARLRLLFS